MPDSLETAALNGSLFTFNPTPPSPTRSNSTSSLPNTDDELDCAGYDDEQDSETDLRPSYSRLGRRGDTSGRGVPPTSGSRQAQTQTQVEHDGPQTGPKGVIEDSRAAKTVARAERERLTSEQMVEANRRALVGLTVHEEDALRKRDEMNTTRTGDDAEEELKEWRRRRKEQLSYNAQQGRNGDEGHGQDGRRESIKRGGLRELGMEGYVDAVERPGWVVVLIYEPGIPRCTSILASLLHLSLNLPTNLTTPISLYRALASSLSFSLLPPTSQTHSITTGTTTSAGRYHDHDDDENNDQVPKGRPDPDVLPTMLVYKDGELERNWVRVDWDVSEDGVEGLLRREGILPPLTGAKGLNRQHLLDHDDDDD